MLMLGKIEGGRRRGRSEDEMVGWYHQFDGHEFEQAPGVGDGHVAVHEVAKSWARLSD